jgi:hypothetical protein
MGSLPVSLNSWVDESNVVLVIEVGSDLLGDLDKSLKGEFVREVLVKVVLVVLELVHVLDGIVVVSHLWEGEGLVVKFLGGNGELGGLSNLGEAGGDLHSVVPVGHLERSGEHAQLELELFLGDLERVWASSWVNSVGLQIHDLVHLFLVLSDTGGGNTCE